MSRLWNSFSFRKQCTTHKHEVYQPDLSDPDFYCKFCSRTFANRASYHRHLSRIYKTETTKTSKAKPRKKIEPRNSSSDSSSTYCQSCDRNYRNLGLYRSHLRRIHNMVLKLLLSKPNHSIEPDPNDPNLYCKSCDNNYLTRGQYRNHIKQTHNINLKPQTGTES